MAEWPVLKNIQTYETSVTVGSPNTHTFPWQSRIVVFVNDGIGDLSLKLGNSSATMTIGAGETLEARLWVGSAVVTGSGDYRLWIYG